MAPVNMPPISLPNRRRGNGILAGAAASAPLQLQPLEQPKEESNWWTDAINTPVIKEIVDALGVGTYSVNNVLSNIQTRMQDASRAGKERGPLGVGDLGNVAQTAWEGLNPGSFVMDLLSGVGKGISAASGNENDVKTASDLIRSGQAYNGIDTESPESRAMQGWLGFGLDVATDPLNAIGLGAATKAVKGAARGNRAFTAESRLAGRTGELSESVMPTRWENVKAEAGKELKQYRQEKYDIAQAKDTAKALKKSGTDADKARYIVENLQTLRPAVLRSIAKTMDDKSGAITAHLDDLSTEDMATLAGKLDDTTPDTVPTDIVDTPRPSYKEGYKYDPQVVGLSAAKIPTETERLVDALGEFRTTNRKPVYGPEMAQKVEQLIEASAAKGITPDKIKNSKLTDLGIKYEHVPLIKTGTKVQDIADVTSVGDLRSIARDIGNGSIDKKLLAPLYEHTGTMEPKEIASFIRAALKEDSFKEAAKNIGKYGTKRTGETPLPYLGVSGHGKLAIPGKGFTDADILAAKTPANPEQSRKFLESRYSQSAVELAGNPNFAELRNLADDVFKETIDVQRNPAGPRRTRRGASTPANLKGAKFETKYNTHSAMYRVERVTSHLRGMKSIKTQGQYDDAFMQVLKEVDDRLRLAGFDQHLTNMALQGDKLAVRLAPSDVFGLMSKSDRINYIHGKKAFKQPIQEFLPTTILDLAEILVRSSTKLTPQGTIDTKAMVLNALHTLQGKGVEGTREIAQNLDIKTLNKNHEAIFSKLDKELETTYVQAFKEAKTQLGKNAVIELAKKQNGKTYEKFAKERLSSVTNGLISKFTKGMADGQPSMVSALVNTNMRNAAVFGGHVAKEIGEVSAKYSEDVLNALEGGSVGEFLSYLVTKPPFGIRDREANTVLMDNVDQVRRGVGDPDEIRHAHTLNQNVKGSDNPSGVNANAYNRNPQLTEELAKPLDEINTEKLFDLTLRELNRDILIRGYGTSRFFNKRSGMPRSFEVLESSSHASSLLMTGFHGIIRNFRAKGWTGEQLRIGMKAAQQGQAADDISLEITNIMNQMFSPSKTNFLTRNSVGPAHFNRILKSVGFSDQFRVPPDALPETMNEIWKTWDITHVEDFMSKLMGAMVKTSEDVSIGASFTRHFASDVPAKGYRRVVDPKGLNPLFPLIDTTKYYPIEVADEMVHIGRLMTESRSFKPGTALHTFVTKIMDPTISSLKMTQTTLKPGHHVMSIIGDMWRNNLALSTIGFMNPARQTKLYAESALILKHSVGDIDELNSFQQFTRVQDIANEIKTGTNDTGPSEFFSNIGNKGGRVSHKQLYDIMQTNGVALPAHLGGMAEDFLMDPLGGLGPSGNKVIDGLNKVTTGLDRLANPLKPKFGMKNPYSLNKFTANRDTWTRGALFLGALRSRNFRNLDDAVEFASNFVKKWSPTAVDLAAAESKYARRFIFYYTWIRGMVPRIIESALMRPGIATIPNKAMYEMAKSNGIDLQSIGDPFPDDKLFPDWYTERVIGPQYVSHDGDLWGANPTGPLGDILNSLGANVKPKDFLSADAYTKTAGNILNMSTPWFKAPIELTMGHTIDRDIPIPDRLQYLQDMIGPARTLSKIQGKELYLAPGPDGLARPNRTESKFKGGMTEQEANQNALPELLNWATGLGFTNYTSDSAEKSAEFQKKAELQAEKKKYERFT